MLPLGARPNRDGNGALDWRVRVFPLRHTAIAVEPPDTESDQHDPGDMRLFHKEARDVELALDNLIVALTVCHGLSKVDRPGYKFFFVAERRLNLARPFKARTEETIQVTSRQPRLSECFSRR